MKLENFLFQRRFFEFDQYNSGTRTDVIPKNANKTYTINHKQYQISSKKERYLPLASLQRIEQIALVLFLGFFSIGLLPYFSKTIRELFKGRQVLRVLKEVKPPEPIHSTQPTTPPPSKPEVGATTHSTLKPLPGVPATTPTSPEATLTEILATTSNSPKVSLLEVLSTYLDYFKPNLNFKNLQAYSQSKDYQRHAQTARIYYNANQLSEEDALKVIFQREPTNISMLPDLYDKKKLKQLFKYKRSVYNDSQAKKSNGSAFKDLPNTAAVYSETYLWNPPGGSNKKEIACLSLPAPALDTLNQPHFQYYVKNGKLDKNRYREEMAFLFKIIEKALRENLNTAFEGKGIQRLVLCEFGQGAFTGGLDPEDKNLANQIYTEKLHKFLENVKDISVEIVMSEYVASHSNDKLRCKVIVGDIVQTAREGDLIVNAWDTHSAPGNGNDGDASFDGAMGKSSAILLTQTSWLNPTLSNKNCLKAV